MTIHVSDLMTSTHQKFEDMPQLRKSVRLNAVYVITHVKSGKMYVGSTTHLYERHRKHRDLLRKGIHEIPELQAAYDDDPEIYFQTIVTQTEEEAQAYEQELLDTLLPLGVLFNRAPNARYAMLGMTHSFEVKDALRRMNIGKKLSPETKEKIRAAMQGRYVSEVTREKLRQANVGKVLSEEHRKNLSAARKGIVFSDSHIEKLRHASIGHVLSEEARRKLSDSLIKTKRAKSPPVSIEGVRYSNVFEAMAALGMNYDNVMNRIRSKNPVYSSWMRLSDDKL
jgi:group I intron endonuclease